MSGLARTIALLSLGGCLCYAQATLTPREYLRLGDAQLAKNDFPAAVRNYTKAIELDPSFVAAYIKRGTAQRTRGNLDAAINDFEAAEQIEPKATTGNRYIAQCYNNRGYLRRVSFYRG